MAFLPGTVQWMYSQNKSQKHDPKSCTESPSGAPTAMKISVPDLLGDPEALAPSMCTAGPELSPSLPAHGIYQFSTKELHVLSRNA